MSAFFTLHVTHDGYVWRRMISISESYYKQQIMNTYDGAEWFRACFFFIYVFTNDDFSFIFIWSLKFTYLHNNIY